MSTDGKTELTIEPLTEREIALARGESYSDLEGTPPAEEATKVEVTAEGDDSSSVVEDTPPADGTNDQAADAATGREAGSDGGKESATITDDNSWLTDELKSYGKSSGLSEEKMATFKDGEELLRHVMLQDQGKLEPEKAAVDPATDPAKGDTASEKTPDGKQPEAGETPKVDGDGLIDVKYYEDNGYDEPTVNLVKALRTEQETNRGFREQVAGLVESQRKQEFNEALLDFDTTLNELYPEFLGTRKGGEVLEQTIAEKRGKVWDQLGAIEGAILKEAEQKNIKLQDIQWPPKEVLYRRAVMAAHGEEVLKMEKERIYGKLKDQTRRGRQAPSRSAPRSGVPAVKQTEETLEESARRIANDPQIAKFYEEQSREAGLD